MGIPLLLRLMNKIQSSWSMAHDRDTLLLLKLNTCLYPGCWIQREHLPHSDFPLKAPHHFYSKNISLSFVLSPSKSQFTVFSSFLVLFHFSLPRSADWHIIGWIIEVYERFSSCIFNNLSVFSSLTVLNNFLSLESILFVPLLLSFLIRKKMRGKERRGRKSDVRHGIIRQRIQRF